MSIGYFLVDLKHPDSSKSGRPPYLGVDRSPWRCVDEKYYSGALSDELVELRKRSFKEYVGNLSFGTLNKKHEVEQLAIACSGSDILQILAVESLGPLSEAILDRCENSSGFGLDAYADGFGSLLDLGIGQHPDVFRVFSEKLNHRGLLSSVQDIQHYVAHYMDVAETENLEIIGDPSQVFIYLVVEVYEMKSA